MSTHGYDQIGVGYAQRRQPDPRLQALITRALGDARSVLNVGAGAGSYEPALRLVLAVEPAATMIAQRGAGAAPVLRGHAEALPIVDAAFDAALAVLTIHHWRDWQAGVDELVRVARARVVLLTWDPDSAGFWLGDYLGGVLERDRARFPAVHALAARLAGAEVWPVPIPGDCHDGFLGAHWRRPEAYLQPAVRAAMSTLADGGTRGVEAGLARLAADLDSGAWRDKYAQVLAQDELDVGYRLIVGQPGVRALLNTRNSR